MGDRDSLFTPTRLALGFGILTIVVLAVAASTSTAAFGSFNTGWEGASELQEIGDTVGATTTIARATTAYSQTTPNGTVGIVLSPDQPYTAAERERLGTFVRNGGTLVVAADYGSHANTLLRGIGAQARVDGRPLRDERVHYRSPAMPRARTVANQSLVTGVDALTLNHGTAVRPNNASVLVATSEYAYLDTNRNGTLDASESVGSYPVATVESLGQGQVIVVGDPSIFINAMLERPGNRAFARNLVAGHSHLLLDQSHTAGLPPLAVALILIRNTPWVQFLGGVAGTLVIFGVVQTDLLTTLRERATGTTAASPPDTVPDEELAAYLRDQYPEWEEDRIQRVVAARRGAPDDARSNDAG